MNDKARWENKTLGVIGGGNMAEALLRGVIAAGLVAAEKICVFDIVPARRQLFADLGCRTAESAAGAAGEDVLLLATKPQNVRDALAGVTARPDQVVASILAGVPTGVLESLLGARARVVRVMPNTPLLVGKGMAALAGGKNATAEDVNLILALFSCSGDAVEVTESELDAVTALSGSGPAYLFRFAEALMSAGENLGLAPPLAKRLTIGTLSGASEMLARSGNGDNGGGAAELRKRVTSPGGTTAAALAVLDAGGFEKLIAQALRAACDRSAELGKNA